MDGTVIMVAIIAAIPATIAAIGTYQNSRAQVRLAEQLTKADDRNYAATQAVKKEVTPNNGKTSGETQDTILDNQILLIEKINRTPAQDEHRESMQQHNPAESAETDLAEQRKLT